MFSRSEKKLFRDNYFLILKAGKDFYEIQSRNTRHCWIVERTGNDGYIHTQHKYRPSVKKYHSQCNSATVGSAIKKIKQHDEYMLKQSKH